MPEDRRARSTIHSAGNRASYAPVRYRYNAETQQWELQDAEVCSRTFRLIDASSHATALAASSCVHVGGPGRESSSTTRAAD